MTAHRNSNQKANRKTRAIQLEQLENRMLCTINGLEQSLLLLNDSLGSSPVAPSVGAANISVQSGNSAPTITTPINSAGNVNTTTSAKSITLSVVATDDGGARALKYNWSVLQSPNGSTARFSRNNNNSASTTVLSFNRVGTYQLQLTVTDGAGLSTTTTQTVTVTPTITRLELQSPGNTVQSGGRSIRTGGSSANLVAIAYDQFGVAVSSPLTYSWRSTATPSGGTATFTSQGNNATVAFTRSGNYSLEATVSGFTLRFSVGVSQTLTSIALTPGTASLNSGQTQQFSAVARDQFAQPMAKQPRFTWTATSGRSLARLVYSP